MVTLSVGCQPRTPVLGMKTAPSMTPLNSRPSWFAEILAELIARRDLSEWQMREAMEQMISGRCSEMEMAALLVALRMKGESALEVATAAAVLREYMVRLETGRDDVLDTCGTGGDGVSTFNISTAAALVTAAAGVPVVKHGNRAVSSRSGSADVLAALGVMVEADADRARRCLDAAGMAFCFAPHFHPALRHVGPVRRQLRIRTFFNCLGPLANPAGASYQLLGVGHPDLLDLLAGAAAHLQARHALLVCGRDGLDEVSLCGPTLVREVSGNVIRRWEWQPEDFGLPRCTLDELRADGPEQSAAIIQDVLDGHQGPARDMVVANAAAALLAAQRVADLREGVAQAAETLTSGRARHVLQRLVTCSQER
jgi:anthranilate phosphoribosyltransferase